MARPASEAGDTLIEVVISALVVGLIVVGTLTGFSVVDRATAQQRAHNEAAVLADQSQEQLRSDPASVLETIAPPSAGHSYTQTISGTIYTITQKAELQPQSGSGASCSVNETKRQSGNAFSITSTVTWLVQKATKRSAVTASSIVTPPTGSAIEVDADNAPVATSGVTGVTAHVTYTPAESKSTASVAQTTGPEGCVVFGGIPATSALVEIMETTGYVTVSGASKYPTKEVTIAPNYTSHYEVVYNKGGAIKAEFIYKEQPKYKHPNNEGVANAIEEEVKGDTFVALNTKMKLAPEFEVGSTRYGIGSGELYEPLPGVSSPFNTYEHTATSKVNLFPFTESENGYWGVYAGDCTENNPEAVLPGAKLPEKIIVTPGGTTPALVPMSYVTLNLYAPTETVVNKLAESKRWEDLEKTTSRPVTITNVKCAGKTPDNETAVKDKHAQETTIEATKLKYGGHLADPFQPFGEEFELCVYASSKTYTTTYKNIKAEGETRNIYLGQRPTVEVENERKAKETEYKTKEAEYKAKETAYKEKEAAYKAKEAYKNKKAESVTKKTAYETEKTKYTTEKTKYETEKSKYNTEKTRYTTEKTNFENYKKEYEKTKKEEYKTKYLKAQTAYKEAETAYKAAETAYKAAETAYKAAETAYKIDETEYKLDETEAAEYETPLHEYETDHAEYLTDKVEYEKAKEAYTTAKSEEEEASKDKVTVGAGSSCP